MIVLDTHIWLWWVNDDTAVLKTEWREMIDNAAEVGISAIVVLRLLGWIGMAVLPCLNQEAFGLKKRCSVQALAWCLFLRKLLRQRSICRNITATQDRIIIATALVLECQLISADRKFPLYQELAGKLVS